MAVATKEKDKKKAGKDPKDFAAALVEDQPAWAKGLPI